MTGTEAVGTRQSQMNQEIEVLDNVVSSISDSVKNLSQHLSPVLRSEPPSECAETDKEDSLVPQANRIRDIRKALNETLDLLNDTQKRLEV